MTSDERREILFQTEEALENNCVFSFIKGSGNGGQKINKTSSAVRVFHAPTGISLVCRDSRSQAQNRHIATRRLRERIAIQIRCDVVADAPAFSFNPVPSVSNPNYPIWLADALDRIALCGWDLKEAAVALNVTRSHLTKALQRDPAVWQTVLYNFSLNHKRNNNGSSDAAEKDVEL